MRNHWPSSADIDSEVQAMADQIAYHAAPAAAPAAPTHQPVASDDRSKNPLRPGSFDEIIGQERAVKMMRRMVESAKVRGRLDHTLMIGPAGTGKTTFANVIANELGVGCYQIGAPVSMDTLLDLAPVMQPNDMLFIDEIHMQAVQANRTAETSPEVFLQLLEDRVIATPGGMIEFPDVTIVGATTDEGMLPDPFIARFPLRPRLERYSREDLGMMAIFNAHRLGLRISIEAADAFAKAARNTPREINNFMRNADSLAHDRMVTESLAHEVLFDLNGLTEDGLTPDQQAMLTFLYQKARRESRDGHVTWQASISTIATAIGKSRDVKSIQLRVEPYLIECGYVQVGHGGRVLTTAGVERARRLIGE
jgi:Holliday junction DNA helicase RuvB